MFYHCCVIIWSWFCFFRLKCLIQQAFNSTHLFCFRNSETKPAGARDWVPEIVMLRQSVSCMADRPRPRHFPAADTPSLSVGEQSVAECPWRHSWRHSRGGRQRDRAHSPVCAFVQLQTVVQSSWWLRSGQVCHFTVTRKWQADARCYLCSLLWEKRRRS